MAISLTHALTPGAVENITHVKEDLEGVAAAILGTYRTIFTSSTAIADTQVAGTYWLIPSVNGLGSGASVGAIALPVIYFDDADYTVAGLTSKLRVRAQVAANATASAITFTVGLYPVTVAGAADAVTYTAGTVVSGSTVAIASPSASTVTQANSGDLTVPSDGAYALAVVTSGTPTADSRVNVHAQLQLRHV